eukprot:CAMPEP_0180518964 /NCGR_PEP_ID=MMETSP1036_2-20121128/55407_1 /TAXON_ID=632150 /ORGANISM="Azadinium spinosum, Strain 3D9" /LENGTH=455 /DNA_ID=CAMNT_0022531215 /DNA_START=8 /DNA_END=1371 /DNA_ORIENTATION=-
MVVLASVYFSFFFIALGGLLFGYIIGINSVDIVTKGQLICPDGWSGEVGTMTSSGYGQCYDLDIWGQGILSAMNLVGATLSSMFCFRYADFLGRKRQAQIGAFLYFVGSTWAAISPQLWGIYVGFLIYGLGIGFAMTAAPMYIAEMAPKDIRGMLVSAKEAMIVLGIFVGFAVGAICYRVEQDGWRAMMGVAASFALIMEVGLLFLHRSPRWLVFRAVSQGEEVEAELKEIQDEVALTDSEAEPGCCETFNYPRPLIIGCGLVFLQQVTGQPSVLYFATNILKDAGLSSSAAFSSVLVGFVKLVATLFTVWRVDQFGRRQLLLWGILLMILALVVLTVAFGFQRCNALGVALSDCPEEDVGLPKPWACATVAALMVYVSGYQIGFGPISWLMISEVFPLRVRGAALSTAAMVNFGTNILMTLCQAALIHALTPAGTFGLYLALSLFSVLFVLYTV